MLCAVFLSTPIRPILIIISIFVAETITMLQIMKKLFIFLLLLTAIPMMAQNTTEYEVKLKNKMHMNVQVCTDGIFRVRFSPRDKYAENLMLRYNVQKKDWQRVDCNTTDKGGVMTITTGLYSLTIDKKDGSISVADKSGKKIVDRVNYLKGTDPLLASLGKDINVKFADRKTYYAAFDEFYKNNNAEPMIELVARYVIERMKQYLEILK